MQLKMTELVMFTSAHGKIIHSKLTKNVRVFFFLWHPGYLTLLGNYSRPPCPCAPNQSAKGALQLRRTAPLGVLADPHWYCPASVVLGVGENGNDLVAHNP